jgi:hypothetical protein
MLARVSFVCITCNSLHLCGFLTRIWSNGKAFSSTIQYIPTRGSIRDFFYNYFEFYVVQECFLAKLPGMLGCVSVALYQGCGSGSGLDPDSATLWIRIRIRIGNPDTDPRARKLRNFCGKNALFNYFFKKIVPLERYKIALTTF